MISAKITPINMAKDVPFKPSPDSNEILRRISGDRLFSASALIWTAFSNFVFWETFLHIQIPMMHTVDITADIFTQLDFGRLSFNSSP